MPLAEQVQQEHKVYHKPLVTLVDAVDNAFDAIGQAGLNQALGDAIEV